MAGTARCSQRLWRKPNSLNDGFGEKSTNPIYLSSDDSATSVHVAQVTVRLFGIFTEYLDDAQSQANPQFDRDPPVQRKRLCDQHGHSQGCTYRNLGPSDLVACSSPVVALGVMRCDEACFP